MTDHDTILVPVSSKRIPYSLDEVTNPRYLRIHQAGPDALVLVPPGADPHEHRSFVAEAMRSSARSEVSDRSRDALLSVLLLVILALLMAGLLVSLAGSEQLFTGLAGAMQAAFIAGLIAYVGVVLAPRFGIAASLFNVRYPARAEDLLRRTGPEAGVRFLPESVFDHPGLRSLHKAVLDAPDRVPDEIWATLWILSAAGPCDSPAAFATLCEQGRQFDADLIAEGAAAFAVEHAVVLEDLRADAVTRDRLDPEPAADTDPDAQTESETLIQGSEAEPAPAL